MLVTKKLIDFYCYDLVPPRFVRQPPATMNVSLKSDAELECSAYGVPTPTIQWFKNGEPIYPSEYFQLNAHTGSLRILGIIAQDEGYYQCLASNQLNTIQAVAQLVVQLDSSADDNDDDDTDYSQAIGASQFASLNNFGSANMARKTSTSQYASSTHPIVHLSAPVKLRLLKYAKILLFSKHSSNLIGNIFIYNCF